MDAVSHKQQAQAKLHLTAMILWRQPAGGVEGTKEIRASVSAQSQSGQDDGAENWERLTTYYDFPREHWKHLRTSNVVESPFLRVRLRTTASRRFKSQINATCLIWKTLMVAEMSFRKLNAPNLVEKVAEGKKYENGKEIRVAA